VTLTTATALGLSAGQTILVKGITPAGYNGTFTATSASGNTVQYTNSTSVTSNGNFGTNTVYSVALQGDGKVLLGGQFANVNGTPRSLVARVLNDPVAQTLLVVNATTVQWTRGGALPETTRVVFQYSPDGVTWNGVFGTGSRVLTPSPGWQWTGTANLPAAGFIRALAFTIAGNGNGSSGLATQTQSYTVPSSNLQLSISNAPASFSRGQRRFAAHDRVGHRDPFGVAHRLEQRRADGRRLDELRPDGHAHGRACRRRQLPVPVAGRQCGLGRAG
jgi:hypothetical protein